MPVALRLAQKIVADAAPLPLSAFFSVSGAAEPAYLVVTAFDRNAYAAGATGVTGSFIGDGVRLGLTPTIGNAREAGIVFTWTGGQYVNAIYGAFSALQYTPSSSAGDVTTLSVFTTGSLSVATRDSGNPLVLAQADPAGNAGSATIVTDGHAVAAQASLAVTPDAIAAAAQGFVGRAWNDQGCWGLAATIAAEAGAGLPITATALGVAGHASGAWVVVYDGPAHASAAWRGLATTGDVITFGTPGGGGHITTCVSGSGATAMLIDNVVYQNAQGQIANAADDGSANDVLITAAHPAAQEWAGVAPNSVVIYALDTPVVTAREATLGAGATPLSALATVSDPAARPITQIQVYDPAQRLTLVVGGMAVGADTASSVITVSSLGAVSVQGCAADVLEVRASNGLYWGDWQSIAVGSAAPMEAPAAIWAQAPETGAAQAASGADVLPIAWHVATAPR